MFSDQEKLALVKASPEAVAQHDKTAWLNLFTTDALVNDPVGSKPHVGHAQIGRFYDSFIAPNKITFAPEHDTVCGDTVVRDLTIVTILLTGLTVPVATHIRYELKEEAGQLKIHRLYAHWQLTPMVLKTLGSGFIGLRSYAKLSVRMLKCQGLGGVMGFMRGFSGGGRRRRKTAENFLSRLAQADVATVQALLAPNAELQNPPGITQPLSELAGHMRGLTWRKVIAGGGKVTASVELAGVHGVVLLEMNRGKQITHVVSYWPNS